MNEQALSFGESRALFGILSLPDVVDPARPAVLIPNTGTDHRTGPGRLHVELARALAAAGVVTLRLDKAGLGDSDLVPGRAAPEFAPDLRAAMDALDAHLPSQGYIIVGFASGAHDAHQAARIDPRIVGAVFLDGYTHHTPRYWINRALDRFGNAARQAASGIVPRTSLTPLSGDALHDVLPGEIHFYTPPSPKQMQADLGEFMRRGLALMYVFTGQIEDDYNYPAQLLDAFPVLRSYARLTLHHLPDADHAFGRRATRDALIALLATWVQAVPPRSAA
ncbi:MAG: hypothetical protein NVS9B10_18790 [Nevskia sp.]